MSWLRIALPWAVGLGILALLVARVDAAATFEALAAGDLVRYLPAALGFVAAWLALDALLLSRLFSHLGPRLGWSRAAWLRASTYPAMALSFHLASVQLVAQLAREQRTGLARSAGGMLVHYLADVGALAAVALAGTWTAGGAGIAYLRIPLAVIAFTCGALLVAGRLGRVLLRERSVVDALAALPARILAGLVLGRVAFHASVALFVWWTAPAFQLSAPLGALLGRMPVVLAVASLPISPGGLGTAHATMLWLFEGFGSEAQILAYGLVYSLTLTVLRLPLGFLAWRMLRSERCVRAELAA
jgi:hypothetical protein